jgi:hypothetical protein
MTRLIHAELIQLRTLRSTYLMGAALVALVVSLTAGMLSEIGSAELDSAAELRQPMVAAAGILGVIVLTLLAATRTGGEYRNDTIGQRVLAAPVRGRLMASKLTTYALVGAVATAVAFGLGYAITQPMVHAEGLTLGLSAGETLRLGGEVVLTGTLMSMLGVGVGILTRSQTAAVVTVFGTFFAEKLLSDVLGDVAHYLPFQLMDSLLDQPGAAVSPGVAGLVLAAITATVAGAAALALRRRDIV